jgi:hypothetical protein
MSLAPTPAASTPPEPPVEPRRWWNGYHVAATITLGCYIAYALLIVGPFTHGHRPTAESPLPPLLPLHAIIMPSLILAVVLLFITAGRRTDSQERARRDTEWCEAMRARWRHDDERWQRQADLHAVSMGAIVDLLGAFRRHPGSPIGGSNDRGESTMDLSRGRAYLSESVLSGGRIETIAARVEEVAAAAAEARDLAANGQGDAGAPWQRGQVSSPSAPTYSEGVLDGMRLANGEPAPEPKREYPPA